MAGSLNYPYARCGLALQRHADSLAMVTVPVGVTETFLFRFFSAVSYDVLGSCVHSVSSCFKENDIAYPKVQGVKKNVPQAVTDQEVKQERFSSGSSLIPPSQFLCLWLSSLSPKQASSVSHETFHIPLTPPHVFYHTWLHLLFQPEHYSLETQRCLRVPESVLLRPDHHKARENYQCAKVILRRKGKNNIPCVIKTNKQTPACGVHLQMQLTWKK